MQLLCMLVTSSIHAELRLMITESHIVAQKQGYAARLAESFYTWPKPVVLRGQKQHSGLLLLMLVLVGT